MLFMAIPSIYRSVHAEWDSYALHGWKSARRDVMGLVPGPALEATARYSLAEAGLSAALRPLWRGT
jgi:hypothetical protein